MYFYIAQKIVFIKLNYKAKQACSSVFYKALPTFIYIYFKDFLNIFISCLHYFIHQD